MISHMKIAGVQKSSTIDYPGNISAVIFTQGCNMNCGYCHNRQLIGADNRDCIFDKDGIFAFLQKRRDLLDAVVVSGGEPTIQKDLPDFFRSVKSMGFKTKLDTNGTNPQSLKGLIDENLLDYVAMDIKAPLCKYKMVCCSSVNTENIMRSIDILKNSNIEYEFRTTYTPELCDKDLIDILDTIKGADKYVLQQYKEVDKSIGEYTGHIEKRNLLQSIVNELMNSVGSLQFRGEFGFI